MVRTSCLLWSDSTKLSRKTITYEETKDAVKAIGESGDDDERQLVRHSEIKPL